MRTLYYLVLLCFLCWTDADQYQALRDLAYRCFPYGFTPPPPTKRQEWVHRRKPLYPVPGLAICDRFLKAHIFKYYLNWEPVPQPTPKIFRGKVRYPPALENGN